MVLVGVALMPSTVLRPEAVLADPVSSPSGPGTMPSVQPTPGLGLSLAVRVVSLAKSFDWSLCRLMVARG